VDNKTLEILLDFPEISVVSVKISKNRIELDGQSRLVENICPSYLKKCKKGYYPKRVTEKTAC